MPTQTDQFGEFMQSNYKSPIKKEFTKDELEQLNKALPKKPKTYLEALQNSENPYSSEYYKKVAEERKDGSLIHNLDTITSILNYKNWGVNDYTDAGNFETAFKKANQKGQKEFMWNNKRFLTERKNENPYKVSTFDSSIIPSAYLSNKLGLSKIDGIVDEKRKIDLSNGKLYFSRVGEATNGKIILGGDYIENEPTSYPAHSFKNKKIEVYGSNGNKTTVDNSNQIYYGIINNKLKTGLINSFKDDDIIVPIRFGGKYDKSEELSQQDYELMNIMYDIQNIKADINSEDYKNFINDNNRPF